MAAMFSAYLPPLKAAGARDQHVGAGGRAGAGVVGRDAAVDLQVDGPRPDHGAHALDLLHHRRDERLPAEARID
jgi:hypothetical protein